MENNSVHEPKHYRGNGKITCKDAERSMVYGVEFGTQGRGGGIIAHWWLSAFEYLWRWPWKNGVEDLKKCRELLTYMIETLEPKESKNENERK